MTAGYTPKPVDKLACTIYGTHAIDDPGIRGVIDDTARHVCETFAVRLLDWEHTSTDTTEFHGKDGTVRQGTVFHLRVTTEPLV